MTLKVIGVDGNMGSSEKPEVCHDGTRVSRAEDMMDVWFSLFRSFLLVVLVKKENWQITMYP